MTILDKIAENARKNPDRYAYYTENTNKIQDGGVEQVTLSWKELDEYSGKLAEYLDKSLCEKKPVIVYGHKNPYMIICFLACVKSGRAYCPIDISVPLNRVEAIIHEVEPEVILTTEELSLEYDNILSLDSIYKIIENENKVIDREKYVSAEDIFYIILSCGYSHCQNTANRAYFSVKRNLTYKNTVRNICL